MAKATKKNGSGREAVKLVRASQNANDQMAELVNNLVQLHKVQDSLLVRLQKRLLTGNT